MPLYFWIGIFILSVLVLLKSSDWLIESAEKIGFAIGLPPFIVGVIIVGMGTSFPELVSALVAVFKGVSVMVTANAVGSNITNILLVVGLAAVVGKRLIVTKSLVDLDLPLLALSTALLVGVVLDGKVVFFESLILVAGYIVYVFYIVRHEEDYGELGKKTEIIEVIPSRASKIKEKSKFATRILKHPKVVMRNILILVLSVVGLTLGAKYLVDSIIAISGALSISIGVLSLIVVSFSTSIPEILVSVKASMRKKHEVALGNIFGSNVFNMLAVVGIPGLFRTLEVGPQTLSAGIPVLIGASVLFIISGISQRIYRVEGMIYLLLYVLFVGKLLGLF